MRLDAESSVIGASAREGREGTLRASQLRVGEEMEERKKEGQEDDSNIRLRWCYVTAEDAEYESMRLAARPRGNFELVAVLDALKCGSTGDILQGLHGGK